MGEPILQVVDLRKHFPVGAGWLPVLQGISFEVETGEFLAITGASGAGKSTLLHLLGALDRPTSGTVFYRGQDLFQLDEKALAAFRNHHLGFIFQFHHHLPEFTALENVLMPALIRGLGACREPEEGARRLLSEVGLSDRLSHHPGELSGGEAQRVAIARALLLEPDLVLADEPTGNLDTRTGDEVFHLLRHLQRQRGITVIFVTHNETLAARADRTIQIADGRLV